MIYLSLCFPHFLFSLFLFCFLYFSVTSYFSLFLSFSFYFTFFTHFSTNLQVFSVILHLDPIIEFLSLLLILPVSSVFTFLFFFIYFVLPFLPISFSFTPYLSFSQYLLIVCFFLSALFLTYSRSIALLLFSSRPVTLIFFNE